MADLFDCPPTPWNQLPPLQHELGGEADGPVMVLPLNDVCTNIQARCASKSICFDDLAAPRCPHRTFCAQWPWYDNFLALFCKKYAVTGG